MFHLSNHQVNKLFDEFALKESKLLNYNSFLKKISGEGNEDRINAAREIMSNLSTQQAEILEDEKRRKAEGEFGMKNRPIYGGSIPKKMGQTIDMKNYETKFIH